MRTYKAYIGLAVVAIAAVLCVACGDSNRNDQGVSFNLNGYWADTSGSTGYMAFYLPLNSNPSLATNIEEPANPGGSWAYGMEAYAGLENHLSGQFIRVERMHLRYYVPGARLQPPSTSVGIPILLGPATSTATEESNNVVEGSSLPGSYSNDSVGYAGLDLVTPDVVSWLNFNRSDLPEPPFVMVVNSYATGVTSAGYGIQSNPVEIQITVTTDNVIPPTAASTDTSDGTTLVE